MSIYKIELKLNASKYSDMYNFHLAYTDLITLNDSFCLSFITFPNLFRVPF